MVMAHIFEGIKLIVEGESSYGSRKITHEELHEIKELYKPSYGDVIDGHIVRSGMKPGSENLNKFIRETPHIKVSNLYVDESEDKAVLRGDLEVTDWSLLNHHHITEDNIVSEIEEDYLLNVYLLFNNETIIETDEVTDDYYKQYEIDDKYPITFSLKIEDVLSMPLPPEREMLHVFSNHRPK
jgi:hypothetical protein